MDEINAHRLRVNYGPHLVRVTRQDMQAWMPRGPPRAAARARPRPRARRAARRDPPRRPRGLPAAARGAARAQDARGRQRAVQAGARRARPRAGRRARATSASFVDASVDPETLTHSKAALAQALVRQGLVAEAMRGGGDGLPLLRGVTAQTLAGVAGEEQVIVFAERVWCLRQLARTLRERHGVEAHVADGQHQRRASSRRSSGGSPPASSRSCASRASATRATTSRTRRCSATSTCRGCPTGLEQRVGRAARPGAARAAGCRPTSPTSAAAASSTSSRCSPPRGAEHHQILDSFEGVARRRVDRSPPSSAQITGQVADQQGRRRLRRHRRAPARRRQRVRRLTTTKPPAPAPPAPALSIHDREGGAHERDHRCPDRRSTGSPPRATSPRDAAPTPLELERARRADPAARRQADLPAAAARPADRRARRARCSTWTTRRESTFLRLIGPPGAGKSQIARAIAYRLWTGRGREVADRHGAPFYGFVEMQPAARPSDEFLFRHEFVPGRRRRRAGAARRLGVRAGDARGVGGDDRRGQHRPRRRAAVDQRHPRRAPQPVPAGDRRDRDRPARVRGACSPTTPASSARTDIPDAWHSRFPATLEVTSNWPALAAARRAPTGSSPRRCALDRQRIAGEDGLCWTPQFRDIESLWRMIEPGRRARRARVLRLQPARAGAGRQAPGRRGGRRLPDARPGRLRRTCRSRPPAGCRTCTATRGRSPHERRHDASGGRRCSCSSCTAPPRSAAGSTPSTRTSPTTGRGSCSACTRCGR